MSLLQINESRRTHKTHAYWLGRQSLRLSLSLHDNYTYRNKHNQATEYAAYLVPVPSQDKLGGLQQEGHQQTQKLGIDGGGSLINPD